jgi:hypothetical protein
MSAQNSDSLIEDKKRINTMNILLQPSDATAIYNERLAIVFGLITLVLAAAAFLSCRTCVKWLNHPGFKNIPENKIYASFYQYHLYYWWAFGVALVAHLMVAVIHTGLPQADDPDAGIHWVILGFGLLSALTALTLFLSCRVLSKLLAMAGRKKLTDTMAFRAFYQSHAYFWGVLAILAAAHFGFAFNHAGIWPGG